jgi:hypothetical protein
MNAVTNGIHKGEIVRGGIRKSDIVRGWYVAESDLKTSREEPRREIREGETLTLPDSVKPEVCEAGYHCARTLLDAFRYRTDGVITRVEVSGDIDVDDDKVAGRSRKTRLIIPREISERECRLFAADVAERLLLAERAAGREPLEASWKAVEVARAYAVGKATDEELRAVARAAVEAARAAQAASRAASRAAEVARAEWMAGTQAGESWRMAGATEAAATSAAAKAEQAAAAGAEAAGDWAAAGAWSVAVTARESVTSTKEELSQELESRLLKAVGYEEERA